MNRPPYHRPFEAPAPDQAFTRAERRILYFAAAFLFWMLLRVGQAWLDGRFPG